MEGILGIIQRVISFYRNFTGNMEVPSVWGRAVRKASGGPLGKGEWALFCGNFLGPSFVQSSIKVVLKVGVEFPKSRGRKVNFTNIDSALCLY